MARNPEDNGYTPTLAQHLVTKAYLESIASGLQSQITALGSGGIPDPGLTPAYGNTGSWGARTTSDIVVTYGPGVGVFAGDPVQYLVDGTYAGQDVYLPANATPAGVYLKFDFLVPVLITEARCYQGLVGTHNLGTWQWEGSNNNTTWASIGSTFTFDAGVGLTSNPGGGGLPGSGYDYLPLTSLSGNNLLWRYYRIKNTAGSWGSRSDNLREFEFKIDRP